jgi:hypothetical protein
MEQNHERSGGPIEGLLKGSVALENAHDRRSPWDAFFDFGYDRSMGELGRL